MADVLSSAFFQVLFDRLASRDLLNFVHQLLGGVSSELKKWGRQLEIIQAVLSDAEGKQLTEDAVKKWMEDLRDLAYDAEDILDEFATEALKRKLMAEDPDQPFTSRVRSSVPACFNVSTLKFNFSMRSKIKEISSRLEELCNQRIKLGLQLTPGGTSTSSAVAAQRRPPSSSVPTEQTVFGRDDDKAKILEMVLSNEPSAAKFRVIPIVGMGGVGKTTLAREVYNDGAVEDFKFDIKAWVCVSDDFDVLSISKAILESITRNPCDLKALNDVQVGLKKAVNGKKLLLVLDDVWNENYDSWAILKAPFMTAAPKSKIIVTTRNSGVASTMGPLEHHNLKALSNEDCWSVFIMHAFDGRDFNTHQISELFREKVVAKCGGLPLAAAALGGLLRSKRGDSWDELLNSNILNLPLQSNIHPVLRLSYHYLPSHLKRCFAYCSIFPKDYEFGEKELVFLWMAEGIIQQSRNDLGMEDWGSECFHDLVSRSIFQQSSGDPSKYVMHDLLHDLAEIVSGETIFKLEVSKPSRNFKKVRHSADPEDVSMEEGCISIVSFPEINIFPNNLRSLKIARCRALKSLPGEMMGNNGQLESLEIEGCDSLTFIARRKLPSSLKMLRIENCKNLQCLVDGEEDASSSSSTASLKHLWISDCPELTRLSSGIQLLEALEEILIRRCPKLESIWDGLHNLYCLQSIIIRGCPKLESIWDGLHNLNCLQSIQIEYCPSLVSLAERGLPNNISIVIITSCENLKALPNNMHRLNSLQHLSIAKCPSIVSFLEEGIPTNLTSLKIGDVKMYKSLIRWGLHRLTSLRSLDINDGCHEAECFPDDEMGMMLPTSLASLSLWGLSKLKYLSSMGFQSLASLENLRINDCPNLTSFPEAGFPSSLLQLQIRNCPKLREVCKREKGKEWSKIAHIPYVNIDGKFI